MSSAPLDGNSQYAVQESSSTDVHPFRLTVNISSRDLELEIDTRCGITLVPQAFWASVNRPALTSPKVRLRTYTGHVVALLGTFNAQVRHAGKEESLPP